MIVVDASAVLEVLLSTSAGESIGARIFGSPAVVHAPHLLDLEVAHVLRRYLLQGALSPVEAQAAFAAFRQMRIVRHPHDKYLLRVWEFRHNLAAYDAAYLALAEGLGATLVTCDAAFDKVHGRRARVEVY